jgi:hypothetical protein
MTKGSLKAKWIPILITQVNMTLEHKTNWIKTQINLGTSEILNSYILYYISLFKLVSLFHILGVTYIL